MKFIKVESSNVDSVGYDDSQQILGVRFNHDPSILYYYHRVPNNVYVGLLSAESVGKYFSKNIKTLYEFSKIKS